jgi:hypothetical protein
MTAELSQAPHSSTSGTPAHYSPSSHLSQLALPEDTPYRSERAPSNYPHPPSHGHPGHLRPLTAPYKSPQCSHPAGYPTPTPATRPFVPFQPQPEFRDPMRPAPATSSRSVYEPSLGTSQYSYPPPPPPTQQNFSPGPTPRAPQTGYQYARPIAPSYSGSSTIIPSGLVSAEQQSAKYECTYCGKGFTRPSSLKVRLLSLTHVSEKKELK